MIDWIQICIFPYRKRQSEPDPILSKIQSDRICSKLFKKKVCNIFIWFFALYSFISYWSRTDHIPASESAALPWPWIYCSSFALTLTLFWQLCLDLTLFWQLCFDLDFIVAAQPWPWIYCGSSVLNLTLLWRLCLDIDFIVVGVCARCCWTLEPESIWGIWPTAGPRYTLLLLKVSLLLLKEAVEELWRLPSMSVQEVVTHFSFWTYKT